jgi:hypothetical protein
MTLEDALGWHYALLVLAVERGQPLLREAGIPKMMVDFPQPMRQAARKYLQGERAVHGPFPRGEGYTERLSPLLNHVFEVLRNEYGVRATMELFTWAQRHFSDQTQRLTWQAWARLLPRLAGSYGLKPTIPAPLQVDKQECFGYRVRRLFDRNIREGDQEIVARAYSIPLTPLEQDLVRLEMSDLHSDDEPYADVVTWLEVSFGPERAYKVWKELDTCMDAADYDDLLEWAREEAVPLGMPPEWVVLPR